MKYLSVALEIDSSVFRKSYLTRDYLVELQLVAMSILPLLRWAAWIGTIRFRGLPRCLGPMSKLFSVAGAVQLSSTYQLVLRVVGKGSPSSLGKKIYKI